MIALDRVSKSYDMGHTYAVHEVSLQVPSGRTLALVGESGCGKTTTLKMVNRLVEPTSGTIRLGDEDVTALDPVVLRRRIGYVIQEIGLFPHYTVERNVGVVPRLLGWPESDVRSRIDDVLQLVGLSPGDFRDRKPAKLSGGQRQRVGFARALAAQPEVMLMDEPFGALDPITRREIQREFADIRKQIAITAIIVTHDMTEALLLGDEVAVMKEGVILQRGTPHDLLTAPEHDYVSELVSMERGRADQIEALIEPGKEK